MSDEVKNECINDSPTQLTNTENEETAMKKPPSAIEWMEKCFQIKASDGSVSGEVTGYVMDSVARNPINLSGTYIGTALLRLASQAAGCERGRPCTGTVLGMKPSSLLTVGNAIMGVVIAITMPIVGAIIDQTWYRKDLGLYSAMLIVAIMAASISISPWTWHVIFFLSIFEGYLTVLHSTTVLAYLPGFSNDGDQLAVYTSMANVRQAIATLLYFALMTGVSIAKKYGAVQTARLSSIVVTINSAILFSYAWVYLFPKTPPRRKKTENVNLILSGFQQVFNTTKKIWKTYRPLKYYILSLPWTPEAGSGSVQTILVTYMTFVLRMSAIEIGSASLILFACQVPGSFLAKYLCRRFNALIAMQISLVVTALNAFLTPIVCSNPKMSNYSYLFAAIWGLCYGCLFPCQRVLYCTLTPKGQETELMGVFAFANQILGWLPGIVFSAINEAGHEMKWGIISLGFFFFLSLVISLFIGNYNDAVSLIASSREGEPEEASVEDGNASC